MDDLRRVKLIERALVLSPHTDDGELSAGGTIARLIDEKVEVFYVAFSSSEKSVPEGYPKNILKTECFQATTELGIYKRNVILLNFEVREFPRLRQEILDSMISIGKDVCPDLVITPSSFDTHQDHEVIYHESLRAFKKKSTMWGMEHPWNNLSFKADIFVKLNKSNIDKKITALRKYDSQSFRSYFEDGYIKAAAFSRGTMVDVEYAEVFESIRHIL